MQELDIPKAEIEWTLNKLLLRYEYLKRTAANDHAVMEMKALQTAMAVLSSLVYTGEGVV